VVSACHLPSTHSATGSASPWRTVHPFPPCWSAIP
jgi:hypothetical protein